MDEEELSRRLDAYEEHRTDKEAAKALGLDLPAYRSWRIKLGLTSPYMRNRVPIEEHTRRYAAYKKFPTDSAAAHSLGMDPSHFSTWRSRRGLKSKSLANRPYPFPRDKFGNFYHAYRSNRGDVDAAKELDVRISQFQKWRIKHSLRSTTKMKFLPAENVIFLQFYMQPHHLLEVHPEEIDEARYLDWLSSTELPPKDAAFGIQDDSLSENQRFILGFFHCPDEVVAAQALGVPVSRFRSWRLQQGLLNKRRVGVPRRESDRRLEAWKNADSDAEAASLVGISPGQFGSWRSQNKLEAKGGAGAAPLAVKEHRRRLSAYTATSSDLEAAVLLGLPRRTYINWRYSAGLSAYNLEPVNLLSNEEESNRMSAYHATDNDRDASELLGIQTRYFTNWRRSRNLDDKNPNTQKKILDDAESKRRLDAYHATKNDAEAATECKIPLRTFRSWRISQELPTKGNLRANQLSEEEHQRRNTIYKSTQSDDEARLKAGVSLSTWRRWRQRQSLPLKSKRTTGASRIRAASRRRKA